MSSLKMKKKSVYKKTTSMLFLVQIYLLVTIYLRRIKTYKSALFIANFFNGHKCLQESEVVD